MRLTTSPLVRRVGLAAAGCALVAAGLAACGDDGGGDAAGSDLAGSGATTSPSSEAASEASADAAGWITDQLTDGLMHNDQYDVPDHSTTVEAAYALLAIGAEAEAVEQISTALAEGVEEYSTPGKDVYAGSTAKLVSFATDTDADPRDFGGVDLVAQLEGRTTDGGAAAGRISDDSEYGDYANSFGQAWAVRGLTNAGSEEAAAALEFLLLQQCEEGYFRLNFSEPRAADQSCDGAEERQPPVDVAALVVVLLHDLADSEPALAEAIDEAVAWILTQQAADGSFEGGSEVSGSNSNSTGLAGWALHVAGEHEAAEAAATWVRAHQLSGCEGELAGETGAIAYDDAGLAAAAEDGITVKTQFQWRLATVQAAPALLATPEGADPAPCDDR